MMAIDGDKSVAQDTATRLKIAGFSPELYDPDILTKLKGNIKLIIITITSH